MPRPEWVQRRREIRELTRQFVRLLDDDRFADAIDKIDVDPQAAAAASRDARAYLRRQNVTVPPGLRIDSIRRSSRVTVELFGKVSSGKVELGVRVRF